MNINERVMTDTPACIVSWFRIFRKEGEGLFPAMSHAIQRCYERGDITEDEADYLDMKVKVMLNDPIYNKYKGK